MEFEVSPRNGRNNPHREKGRSTLNRNNPFSPLHLPPRSKGLPTKASRDKLNDLGEGKDRTISYHDFLQKVLPQPSLQALIEISGGKGTIDLRNSPVQKIVIDQFQIKELALQGKQTATLAPLAAINGLEKIALDSVTASLRPLLRVRGLKLLEITGRKISLTDQAVLLWLSLKGVSITVRQPPKNSF